MANLEATLILQQSRADFIETTLAEVQSASVTSLGGPALETQLHLIETYWEKLETTHEKIVSTSGKVEGVTTLPYFADKLFDRALSNYAAVRVLITQLIDKAGGALSTSTRHASTSGAPATGSTRRALPEISLPKFSGAYAEWRAFRDLFNSLVGNNPELSNVERMHYLLTSLSGESSRLISNLTVSEDSFAPAWELLVSRYENKRFLVSAHLDRLLCSSPMASHSAAELNLLIGSVTEALSALHALGSPTEHWGTVVAHVLVRRLSPKLREAWENKMGGATEYPTLEQLMDFLKGRARAMENLEIGSHSTSPSYSTVSAKPATRSSAKVNATLTARPAPIQSTRSAAWPLANRYPCSYCEREHFIASCPDFRDLTPQARKALVDRLYLCFNCLGKHSIRVCQTTRTCQTCQQRHHTLLHLGVQSRASQPRVASSTPKAVSLAQERARSPSPKPGTSSEPPPRAESPAPSAHSSTAEHLALVINDLGSAHPVRLLLDPGSELSLISTQTARRLHLKKKRSAVQLSGVGDSPFGTTSGIVILRIKSCHSDYSFELTAHLIDHLISAIPTFPLENAPWAHLQGLQLADPGFFVSAPVDLLIGADVFGQLVRPEVVKAGVDSPVAQSTHLGWIVYGPTGPTHPPHATSLHVKVSSDQLRDLLTAFWVQEEVPEKTESRLTTEERECEEYFLATHSRDDSGRYIVRLPFSVQNPVLGDSYRSSLACLRRLAVRLGKNPRLRELYTEFLEEYETLGHMRRAPIETRPTRSILSANPDHLEEMTLAPGGHLPGGSRVSEDGQEVHVVHRDGCFLPHHAVLKEASETTKLRVVFNGSAKTTSGRSLNDLLHTGANLQRSVADVLLWSRQHRFVFIADITKMFRQIKVHEDDWPAQQILWTDANGEVSSFQLTTVTYGTRPAPFLACRTLLQLVTDEGHRFPMAVAPLTQGRYVDDICGGADTVDQLCETCLQVIGLCQAGGFPLAKWQSNVAHFLSSLDLDNDSTDPRAFQPLGTKLLGLLWKPSSDQFAFSTKEATSSIITKRIILSELAQIYDPLGFLAPVVIRGKTGLQELWLDRLGWDDEVPPLLAQRWMHFRSDLTKLSDLPVPRWLGLLAHSTVEIHGFCDASQIAMAAVIYLKVINPGMTPSVTLVCSKTRVAPLKRLTIPRLELSAAVLLVRLLQYVTNELSLQNASTFLWTDSSVTLAWISSHPSRWKEYIRNRVQLIQEVASAQWRLVPGKANPADCASRGISAAQLAHHPLWWHGPPWLTENPVSWPVVDGIVDPSVNLEENPGATFATTFSTPYVWELVDKFSSVTRLLRVTATCQRVVARLRRTPNSSLATPLTRGDLELARLFWIRTTQAAYFSSELKNLSRGQRLGNSHPMTRLTAFVDHQGVLRVGGRLALSQLDRDSKHPVILPRESQLARLFIKDAHLRTFHGGTQLTLAQLRRSYWILGGRAPVRSFIYKCVPCARHRGIRAQQLMGQLPVARLTPARAFLNTGVDYAGPVSLRSWKGRGHKSYKGWLSIFVCMVTSAVHLEVVSDYTAEGFLAAYRRFIARRGLCRNLYSDCGTTFVGADTSLKRLFSSASRESRQLAQLLLSDGTQWAFNPPGAPHFGGKWEAAVKSVKFHLTRTIGEALLTFEELSTLLAQIEAVLNSRPLEPLSDDPDDVSALTPGHFLVGHALTAIPEPSLEHLSVSRLSRWQLIQQKVQFFWKRWSSSYLQHLQSVSKWHHPSRDIKIGSVVLVSDERFPPTKWPLARVTALHPGKDGLTRVVTIKTASSTFDRPIARLVPLPVLPPQDQL